MWRAAGSPQAGRAADFRDVAADAWYAPAVSWAEESGVVRGTRRGLFRPSAVVTREQLYVMMDRLLERQGLFAPVAELPVYEDGFRVSAWARQAVEQVERAGFSSLNDRELLRPGEPATRAEAAELVSWYLGLC